MAPFLILVQVFFTAMSGAQNIGGWLEPNKSLNANPYHCYAKWKLVAKACDMFCTQAVKARALLCAAYRLDQSF